MGGVRVSCYLLCDMRKKPYLFTFWTSQAPMPAYIAMCRDTVQHNLADHFRIIELDYDNCLDWVPERDRLWQFAAPVAQGKSHSMAGRHIAQFTGMLRVALLARHGGLWVDADQIAFANFAHLAPLVMDRDLVAPEDADGSLTNAVVGARQGSPFAAALWDELQRRLAVKQDAGEMQAGWGEHGFRMLNHVWQSSPPEQPFVAPFGTLISVDTSTEHDVFAAGHDYPQALSPLALGLSVFNNGVGAELRAMSARDLRAQSSLFAMCEAFAMGHTNSLTEWLMVTDTDQLAALDRSAHVAQDLQAAARAQEGQAALKTKLQERNAQITKLRRTNKTLDARLQQAKASKDGP